MNGLSRRALMVAALALPLPVWASPRPKHWAQPVTPAIPGLPNLHKVSPQFYRAAQPDAQGFAALPALGVTTVLSLRQLVDDRPLAEGSGLTFYRVPMKSRAVGEEDSARILAALRVIKEAKGPILVHCRHGADRTGVISALYRMIWQGWSRDEALAELVTGGFGFHSVWQNIPRYLAGVDVARLKARLDA